MPRSPTSLKKLLRILPWIITVAALYYAFHGVDWGVLLVHIGGADWRWVAVSLVLTALSYSLRARRWQYLFPDRNLNYGAAARALILGFFMNNILPARTGELVRAHIGAKLARQTRTLVLATIAAERLIDGLTLSLFFVAFAVGIGNKRLSENLLYVALMFAVVAALVIVTLVLRHKVFAFTDKLGDRFSGKASSYTLNRIQVFIHGLSPLTSRRLLPILILWSFVIWGIELGVYLGVSRAFDSPLSLSYCVLFMVAVNFSSLIPAAPGGIGVIEAIATTVLVSIGIEKEHALSMVLMQHFIQYLVVGIPGAAVMFSWRKTIKSIQPIENGPDEALTT